jgi:hypothetical protein
MANKYGHHRVQGGWLPVFGTQNLTCGFWDWSLQLDRLAA